MTLAQWRQWLREQLAGGESPAVDADVLLCHVLARPRSFLLAWPEYEPTPAECERLSALLARRRRGEPVAYLTGEWEFWSLALEVSPATLIPRPDTEVIIEAALARLPARPATLVDLGTGTGAIALALKSERPDDVVLAVEFNPEAAALARRNGERLGLAIEVHQGSWFEPLDGLCFDMILSNPPYIDVADPHLQAGDVRFEPASALVAEQHGMADLHHLIVQSRDHLESGGWLLLEHGWEQGALVRDDFAALGYQQIETLRDYGGQERITLAQWPGRLNAENEHQ